MRKETNAMVAKEFRLTRKQLEKIMLKVSVDRMGGDTEPLE